MEKAEAVFQIYSYPYLPACNCYFFSLYSISVKISSTDEGDCDCERVQGLALPSVSRANRFPLLNSDCNHRLHCHAAFSLLGDVINFGKFLVAPMV